MAPRRPACRFVGNAGRDRSARDLAVHISRLEPRHPPSHHRHLVRGRAEHAALRRVAPAMDGAACMGGAARGPAVLRRMLRRYMRAVRENAPDLISCWTAKAHSYG